MKRWMMAGLAVALGACGGDNVISGPGGGGGDSPAAPRSLDAWYYEYAVNVTWELAPDWDGESFRVYAKRVSDNDHFLIAEVTNCTGGVCTYADINISPGVTYNYYVAAVNSSGQETTSANSVDVAVPQFTPPPVPTGTRVVALDGASYLRWDDNARSDGEFSFYRVYLRGQDDDFLLGETDSQGFLDELAENGSTYTYFVSAVDVYGHESGGSAVASGTPRPDYHGEWIYAYSDSAQASGFRFTADEATLPIVDGDSPTRHFRFEVDAAGWWLVPGPQGEVHPTGVATTQLKCGPGADADCVDLSEAPSSGYSTTDVSLAPETSYALRVTGDDGATHYGVVRVELLGFDQDGRAIMIFSWAYQLQAGVRSLSTGLTVTGAGL